jgi:hypothetical protein
MTTRHKQCRADQAGETCCTEVNALGSTSNTLFPLPVYPVNAEMFGELEKTVDAATISAHLVAARTL